MKRIALVASILALGIVFAHAQTRARSTQTGGTIAVTDTFQAAKSADDTRKNCTLQNKGANTMYVYFGPTASATKDSSFEIAGQGTVSTSVFGLTIIDVIAITGTAADKYVVACQ